MGSQALAAIVAFAAGVIVTSLSSWFSQRLERRKHVTQFASIAFADLTDSVCTYQAAEAALASLDDQVSDSEKQYWRRQIYEARAEYFSAKARFTAFASSELNWLYARIERRGGITGNDPITRELVAKTVLSLRKELGYKKNDVSEQDIAAVIFGPTSAELGTLSADGLRGWGFPILPL
jgi:hypothetical protein